MVVETVQVVDALSLKIPRDIFDYLSDKYEVINGSYHRYYPGRTDYVPEEYVKIIDESLHEVGVIFPEELSRSYDHPNGYFKFYVLLYFSW